MSGLKYQPQAAEKWSLGNFALDSLRQRPHPRLTRRFYCLG